MRIIVYRRPRAAGIEGTSEVNLGAVPKAGIGSACALILSMIRSSNNNVGARPEFVSSFGDVLVVHAIVSCHLNFVECREQPGSPFFESRPVCLQNEELRFQHGSYRINDTRELGMRCRFSSGKHYTSYAAQSLGQDFDLLSGDVVGHLSN